jgi:hypothetical protein
MDTEQTLHSVLQASSTNKPKILQEYLDNITIDIDSYDFAKVLIDTQNNQLDTVKQLIDSLYKRIENFDVRWIEMIKIIFQTDHDRLNMINHIQRNYGDWVYPFGGKSTFVVMETTCDLLSMYNENKRLEALELLNEESAFLRNTKHINCLQVFQILKLIPTQDEQFEAFKLFKSRILDKSSLLYRAMKSMGNKDTLKFSSPPNNKSNNTNTIHRLYSATPKFITQISNGNVTPISSGHGSSILDLTLKRSYMQSSSSPSTTSSTQIINLIDDDDNNKSSSSRINSKTPSIKGEITENQVEKEDKEFEERTKKQKIENTNGDTTDLQNTYMECCICEERPSGAMLYPCGHVKFCVKCASSFKNGQCPICRSKVESVIKAFF